MKAMQDALAHINRYPDGSGHYLRQAIARKPGPHQRPHHPRQRLQRPDRADGARVPALGRGGGDPASLVRGLPDDRAGGRRHPGGGDAQGPAPRPRGDGARHHPHDQDGVHREPQQPHRDHRDRGRGRALHGPGARQGHRGVRRGLHRVRPGARLPRRARLPQAGPEGRGASHLLEGGEPGRAAGRATRRPIPTASRCSTASASPSTSTRWPRPPRSPRWRTTPTCASASA